MRKIIIIAGMFITLLFANNTKAFDYTLSLFDCLHNCNGALDYMQDDTDDLVKFYQNHIDANNYFKQGKLIISKYKDDTDETIKTITNGVMIGIDELIIVNNKRVALIQKVQSGNQEALNNWQISVAKINSEEKEAWKILTMAASYIQFVILEPVSSDSPKGKLPFKISKDEREKLTKKFSKLFKEDLKKYWKYRKLSKKGKEGNPKDQTWLVFSLDNIYNLLTTETYEQAKRNKD